MFNYASAPFSRIIIKLLFLLPGYIYHLFYLLLTPFSSIAGLGVNLLLQLQLGVYVRANIFGGILVRIFSIALLGIVDAIYLTELGVHFKSKFVTIISIISFILSIFAPLLRVPIAIVQAFVIVWVSLREFRNHPKYCSAKLIEVGLKILEGFFYILAAFIPFPIRAAWINWSDIARGVTSIGVIQRIRTIDFNKPHVLDISFLWNNVDNKNNITKAITTDTNSNKNTIQSSAIFKKYTIGFKEGIAAQLTETANKYATEFKGIEEGIKEGVKESVTSLKDITKNIATLTDGVI